MTEFKKKRRRKPMRKIVTRKINYSKFKINKALFKQAAALAKYKNLSIVSLLSDYLTIGIVGAAESLAQYLGIDEWQKYCETAWEEANRIERPLPRFKKRSAPQNQAA